MFVSTLSLSLFLLLCVASCRVVSGPDRTATATARNESKSQESAAGMFGGVPPPTMIIVDGPWVGVRIVLHIVPYDAICIQ